ncbi:MAG TPA: DUF4012 domain-containing protein [Acidimicrobiales bacterium]|nr:DUF4012 domain-containing protein [Acidimicrobiales bacterium]
MAHRPTATDRRLRRLSGRRPLRGRLPRRPWLITFAVIVVLLGLWTAWDLRAARRDLLASRQELSAAAADLGNAADAQVATRLRTATRHAVARTTHADRRVRNSPVLRVAGWLPVLRTQRSGLLRAVRAARDAAAIGDQLAAVAQRHANQLAVHDGTVDLASLQALGAATARAGAQLRAIKPTHSDAQWGPLGHATTDLDALLGDTATRLTNGAGVMGVAADLLGAHGPKHVFVALLNNAEMRDQGMVLSYAVADTANGAFRLARSGSTLDIPVNRPVTNPAVPTGTQQIFGGLQPNRLWQSVNGSADTSLSGALMRAMYQQATGERADAVVAIDVPTLAALLSVTGPVTVPGIDQPITAANAAPVLLDDLYAQAGATFRDPHRLEQVAATLTAVVSHVQSGSLDAAALVHALGGAARGGHTWVSTADPAEQTAIERAGLGGSPGRFHPERTIHVSVQNGTATKLDYFVDPSVDMSVALTKDGTAVVTTTVTLPNTAPVPTPPGEQFGPDGFVSNVAGLYRARVYFWGPSTADQLDSVAESGLRLNFQVTDVLAGHTGKVSFTSVVPHAVRHGRLALRFVPQPRVRPMHLKVQVSAVGWRVEHPSTTTDWDRTLDLSWSVRQK